jgi:SAM-dependent methyltransferase
MPRLADVAFLYDGRESQDFQPDARRGLAHRIKDIAFARQATTLLRHAGIHPRRVLDFGCGSGQFTRCLGNLLNGASVVGSDFHSTPPPDLAGRPYLSFDRLREEGAGTFDLVLAMHVLEHDDDPAGLIDRIAAMVRPGGTILFEVPNIDCVWTQLLGQYWDAWYLPFHRSHFSRRGLRALVERADLEIVSEHSVCLPTMGRSLANLLRRRNNLIFLLAGIALHPVQWLLEKATDRPSAIRLIVRRELTTSEEKRSRPNLRS